MTVGPWDARRALRLRRDRRIIPIGPVPPARDPRRSPTAPSAPMDRAAFGLSRRPERVLDRRAGSTAARSPATGTTPGGTVVCDGRGRGARERGGAPAAVHRARRGGHRARETEKPRRGIVLGDGVGCPPARDRTMAARGGWSPTCAILAGVGRRSDRDRRRTWVRPPPTETRRPPARRPAGARARETVGARARQTIGAGLVGASPPA